MKSQRISLIALAIAGTFSGVAHADPAGITLYGVLDAGVATVQHQGNFSDSAASTVNIFSPAKATAIGVNTGSPVNGVVNGGIQDSRWGIRGTEDLGDGLKAVFTLESGINLPTGQLNNNDAAVTAAGTTNAANSSLGGQLFNRQAWVGLKSDTLGQLTLGRQYMPIYDVLTNYDNVQFAQNFSPLSFSGGLGGGIGVSEDMREDNSLKYVNRIGAFNFEGLYKFGGIDGHNGARSDYAFNLGYEDNGFGVQAVYERLFDAIKGGSAQATFESSAATPFTGITGVNTLKAQVFNSVGYMVAAKYNFAALGASALTARAGFSKYDLTNGDLSTSQMGVTTLNGNTIGNGTTSNTVLGNGVTASTRLYWLGGDYGITSKDNLGLSYYHVASDPASSSATAANDAGQAGYTARYYAALYDHSYSKRTDVYAGVTFAQFSGFSSSLVAGNAYSTNKIIMLGMRTKF